MTGSLKRQRIRAHYEPRIAPERENFDVLDWGSRADQFRRFQVMVDAVQGNARPRQITRRSRRDARSVRRLDLNTSTLLDVGCGLADLGAFLQTRAPACRYVGVDLTPGILAEARRRSAVCRLVLADVFEAAPFRGKAFDLVTCSGVFNLKLGNNDQFVTRALDALFSLAGKCVVANFLHHRTRRKYPHCYYYDPEQVCANVPEQVAEIWLFDDYLENDFTVVLWR
ncbi:MAG: class I SAM-dependent methyltransferase [Kiritimatiellaeota bacterium]|nr:class I SAM-dependent methyltransferase [Kiritimatiellota bacterium]